MTDWTAADLDRIGSAGELQITTRRADGSLRPYVPVWVVRVGDQLFARSWRGQAGTWYRHARQRPDGRVRVGGTERDIAFDLPQAPPDEEIDRAYRAKYGRYGGTYVGPMTGPDAKAATVRLRPADTDTGRRTAK
jgi:hypothetical protein